MNFCKTSAFAFSLLGALGASGNVASAAPSNLQYDEIVRVVIGQATAPTPSAFQADLAAINSPASPEPAQPPKKRGFGNMLGAVLKGESPISAAVDDVAESAASKAMSGMFGSLDAFRGFMNHGKVARYTYYNGWERVDDLAAHTATITKNDRHQSIALDLDKKTYRVVDLSAPSAVAPATASSTSKEPPAAKAPPRQAGTAVVDLSLTGTALGPQTLDGVPTAGYTNTVTMAITQATGSCRNGSFSVLSLLYLSAMKEPQVTQAPHDGPRPSRVPTDPRGMVSQGGCAPTFTVHGSGATPPSGRFLMYSRVAMQPQNATASDASGFAFVTERGNVKTLSDSAAAALFEAPADFVREQ